MNKKGTLSEAAWINPPAKLPISSKPTDEVAFIPMASVSETGCLQNVETRLLGSCLKGYTAFQKGDVLVAKITPCMENGKATVVENILSPIGFGSTEFHVIRPKPNFDSRYLFHAVWNPTFRLEAGKNMTGSAGQKRVPKSFLERFEIPLPPIEEQKRIADILDKADAIRRKRQEALRLNDEFLRSVFLEMFGDPVTNPKQWPVFPLKSLGRISTGSTPPSSKKDMFGGSIPFITPGDLKGEWVETVRFVTEEGAQEARTIRAGATLVCCIGATIGKMGKSKTHSAFNQQINAVEWNEQVADDYGLECLKFFKPQIAQKGASTTLPILNKSSFQILEIPLAPIELQERFTRIVKNCEANKAHSQESLKESQNLFASLQQRAFSGELLQ